MKEMTKQDLNRVSAMILSGVECDENYQPKFAVDCFVDCESGNAVKVLWAGDYEFSLWNPAEDWRHLGEVIQEFGIILTPINKDNSYYHKYGNRIPQWQAIYPSFVGEDPWGYSSAVINYECVDYDVKPEGRDWLCSVSDKPNEAVLRVLVKAFPLINK